MECLDEDDDTSVEIVCKSSVSAYFDKVIGHVEDIVLSKEFEELRTDFLETHYEMFEDTEENKLEYMDVFRKYTMTFENFIITELSKRMEEGFDMEHFANEFSKDDAFNIGFDYAEILELLYSLTDFETFKQVMLDYRMSKQLKLQNVDLDSILITKPMILNKNHDQINERKRNN